MARFALVAIALVASLLSPSSGVNALCLACPNCDGVGCLEYWTCDGTTITCYYPSADGTTYVGCEFDGTPEYTYYEFDLSSSSPSDCDGLVIGDNRDCIGTNKPWNWVSNECTAAEGYVGEPGS
ncbi:hypothetical protein BU15DRAFT_64791 [Melanogaster broomeanus]|nr:hypothetical protein BU15DRAFT_64791 [Melanogaster broomeanus]